jgi:alcohol dehydrogenase class IV
MPGGEPADLLADRVRALADGVGVPGSPSALGVTRDDVPRPARTAMDDACLWTDPRDASPDELEALFRAVL